MRLPVLDNILRGGWLLGRVLTFACVVAAWVLFRAEGIEQALRVYRGMAGGSGIDGLFSCTGAPLDDLRACARGVPTAFWWIGGLILVAMTMPNTQQLTAQWRPAIGLVRPPGRLASVLSFQPSLFWAVLLAVLFAVSVVWLHPDSPFLYYQF